MNRSWSATSRDTTFTDGARRATEGVEHISVSSHKTNNNRTRYSTQYFTTKPVFMFAACDKKIDLVFAIDASGSIEEPDFQRILNFVRDLVSQLEVDSRKARVGFVVYSDNPKLIFHLDAHDTIQAMSRDIVDTKYMYGKTNTAAMFRWVPGQRGELSHLNT